MLQRDSSHNARKLGEGNDRGKLIMTENLKTFLNAKERELEEKIADLKGRWPAHSVPPSMWRQLDELEAELEEVEKQKSA